MGSAHDDTLWYAQVLRERAAGPVSPCEAWTSEQKGRALEMIRLLAVTPPSEWRTKREIHSALAEFRAATHSSGERTGEKT